MLFLTQYQHIHTYTHIYTHTHTHNSIDGSGNHSAHDWSVLGKQSIAYEKEREQLRRGSVIGSESGSESRESHGLDILKLLELKAASMKNTKKQNISNDWNGRDIRAETTDTSVVNAGGSGKVRIGMDQNVAHPNVNSSISSINFDYNFNGNRMATRSEFCIVFSLFCTCLLFCRF